MNGKRGILVCVLVLCIVAISCQKTQMPVPPNLKLSFETIKTQNSIPEEYGELESAVVDSPDVARMFFEKDDKSLVVVTVNMRKDFFVIVSRLFHASSLCESVTVGVACVGLALDYFVYRAVKEIGALAAVLGGIDGLVFTAGIGENSAEIRRDICESSAWLGLELDAQANANRGPRISRPASRISGDPDKRRADDRPTYWATAWPDGSQDEWICRVMVT